MTIHPNFTRPSSIASGHGPSLKSASQSALIKALAAFDLVPEHAPVITTSATTLREATKLWPDPALYVHLTSDNGVQALFVMNFQAVTALVENAVRGKVLEKPVIMRDLTAVDYSLCETFIANFLCGLDDKLADGQFQTVRHLNLNGVIGTRHEIEVFFDEGDWTLTSLEFQFRNTSRRAQMWLLSLSQSEEDLHASVKEPPKASEPNASVTSRAQSGPFWKDLPVTLKVTSQPFKVPLHVLQNLEVGMEIPVPRDLTQSGVVQLENAHARVRAVIGQDQGLRAVQLLDAFSLADPDDEASDDDETLNETYQPPK